ncbi:hypothetical protein QYE76_008277 [Lolium multiflorum]|uniref:Arabidopsis retrotransposon Orf1 C-terminal domain-containing protein n=1 Tax=Lolium multiflorum TaxID=4521 RepID=A0AAD8PX09_LOLMU|nr:hypothetical protein QYE76_008277 [Lolium multiflorum]
MPNDEGAEGAAKMVTMDEFKAMETSLSASNELWRIIVEGFNPYNPNKLTRREAVDSQLNDTALHMIQTSVGTKELSRVRNFTTAKEAWDGLAASCIGSDSMRRNKYNSLWNQAEGFMRLPDEDHEVMYGRLLTVADAFRNVGATHINDSWIKDKYIDCLMPFEPIDVKTLVGRECYSSLTSQQVVHEMQALKVLEQNSRDSRNRAIGMSKGNNLALTVNSVEEVNPQEQYRASWSMSYPEDLEFHYNDHMAFHAKSFWVDPSKAKEDNIKRNNKSGFTSLGPRTRSCYNCDDKRHFIAECPYENRETHGGRLIPKDKSKDSKGKYSKAPNKKFYNKSKKGKRPPRIVLVTREEYSSNEVKSSSDEEEESSKEVAAIVTTNIPSSSLFESPNENPHIKNAHCFMARSTLDTSIVLSTQEEYSSGDDDEEDDASNGLVALASLSTNSSSPSESPNEVIHVEEESCLMAKSSEDYAAGGSKWVLDSGCTSHMTGGKNLVKESRPNTISSSPLAIILHPRKRTPDDAEELLAKIGRNHDVWSTPEPTPAPIVKKRGMIKLNDEDMREAKKSLKEKGIKPEDVKNLPPIEDLCEITPPSSMIEKRKMKKFKFGELFKKGTTSTGRPSRASTQIRRSYNEDIIAPSFAPEEDNGAPNASSFPCYDFLTNAGILDDFFTLVNRAGLATYVGDEREQYYRLTKIFVESFKFHNTQYEPTVAFKIYDNPVTMELEEFCRALDIAPVGTARRIDDNPRDLLELYRGITEDDCRTIQRGKIRNIQLPAIKYFAYYIATSILGRENTSNISSYHLAFLNAALTGQTLYHLGSLIARRLSSRGPIFGGTIALRILTHLRLPLDSNDVSLTPRRLDIAAMKSHHFVTTDSTIDNMVYRMLFADGNEKEIPLPQPGLFNIDRQSWSLTKEEVEEHMKIQEFHQQHDS